MAKQSKTYTHLLSDVDRVTVRIYKDGSVIMEFSVQYESLINSRWRKITRFDNAHGSPHRHVYYPNDKEYKHPMNTRNYNDALTEAQTVVKKNFIQMRETYIILMERKDTNND